MFWLSFRDRGFAVVIAPGETPGPIPNPVAKARRGDGTALERVWESSTPPLQTLGVPVELTLREPFFYP